MFFNADDDESDFMAPGGSKLANLFGMDRASGQGGNESLTYTAPKQPKKKEPAADAAAAPALVVASVVHAYKYVDNKYASQGKLGAALLATHATKEYRILLYINKQQQVTTAKISSSFAFNVQQNNYASFYDDARQTWSIMFESAESAEKFAKEIAVIKAASAAGPLTELIQQDLVLGEGGALESGDSVEVKYTGWLFTNGTFGKIFDQSSGDKLFRFKVGKGKVIKGWDQGMLGMKKGGKKMLVIPPSLAYGSTGAGERIPPDSTLIFEVQVVRVKLQKGESPQESPAPTPAPAAVPVPEEDIVDDPGVKGRTKSINEHMSQSPDSGKAKLISRMARMGQPMLPFQGAVAAQPEDSDEDMHHQSVPASVKPNLPTKPRSASGSSGMAGHMGHPVNPHMQAGMMQPGVTMVGNQPMIVTTTTDMLQQQQQQQPAFLQNLPGAQQLAVYQNPNNFLQQQQQQQAALLQQQQQQQLLQQQQQQQQFLGQGMPGTVGGLPVSSSFGAPVAPAPVSAPPTSSSTDSLAPVLLTETRQQNTEVRLGLSKMSDKVDKILEKLEHMNAPGMGPGGYAMGAMTPYGGGMPAPSMEANVLMQNITRIVQENERLKKEVYEQSNKVHEQNEKIASLLEKNQKYVEQSQSLLEQRNEGYKNTASQSQAKVLSLEQEKVQLATELSSASAQISTLQLELGDYRKREGELKQQLQMTSTTSSSAKEELERLRLQREEDEQKISSLTSSVREEKQARKQIEAKLSSHMEELSDLKGTNETLERNLSERKRKAAEERRKMEDDMEDAKLSYEQTIEGLRERLRKQKTSVDAETESKVSKIEEEISRDWQTKCDRMMAAATEKHNRQLADVKEEKEELVRKVDELEKKLVAVRSSGSSTETQISQLQDELTEMRQWKDKYDNLRSQATTMKEKYEKRIEELEEEEETKSEAAENAQQQIQQLQQQIQQLRSQQSVSGGAVQQSAAPPADVSTEVKKIMNSVFQSLRGEFDAEDSYSGSEVLSTILNVIKQTTLKLVSQAQAQEAKQEESEEEEEEEEEDDEEEEEDEEQEEGEEEAAGDKEQQEEEAPVSPATNTKPDSSLAETEGSQTANQSEQQKGTESAPAGQAISETPMSDTVPVNENIPASLPEVDETSDNDENTEESGASEVKDNSKIDDKAEPVIEHGAGDSSETKAETVPNGVQENENVSAPDDLPEIPEKQETSQNVSDKTAEVPPPVSNNIAAEEEVKVPNGVDSSLPPTPESSEKGGTNEQSKQAILEASTMVAPKPVSDVREDPPPLFDEDEDDEDSPLFGEDDTVSDTLGSDFKPKPATDAAKPANNGATPGTKGKSAPGKKVDLMNDEDLKPQPPPPLFGDDSDDDDLDWLS